MHFICGLIFKDISYKIRFVFLKDNFPGAWGDRSPEQRCGVQLATWGWGGRRGEHGDESSRPVSEEKGRRLLGTHGAVPPARPPPFRPPLRGVQQGPVQKRGVVVVLEVISLLAQHRAVGRLVVGGDADGVRGVVEVDHVDVKHQHGRARDVP